jgi:hypothetical protein
MIDISTIGMVVIFIMAFFIVSWQAERVRKAEDALGDTQEEVVNLLTQIRNLKDARVMNEKLLDYVSDKRNLAESENAKLQKKLDAAYELGGSLLAVLEAEGYDVVVL